MANSKKLTISRTKNAAITITRIAISAEKLVYVAVANKSVKYHNGKSRVVYIGTTASGADRIASSAAAKARELLEYHGIKLLDFFVVTCTPRRKVQTWKKLESGLILTFRAMYGDPPLANTHGKSKVWSDELDYFTFPRLQGVLKGYE
jgi:hypothetical protein